MRASEPALVHDGAGGMIAGWTASGPDRGTVQVRRIAPGGITGAVRTLSRGTGDNRAAPVLAGAAGRVVAAWVERGDVRYSVYR